MAILRRCRGRCSNPRRCLEHLWFDVMLRGSRYRTRANDFAVPRMEPGKQRPIESMEEAHHWSQRDRRGTQERTGGELEQQRPTASTGLRKLIGLNLSPNCPRIVPGICETWLRGPATI